MSATGRGAVRQAHDGYGTPRFAVDRLLDAVDLPGGLWLEPGAGHGAIIRAVNARRSDVQWSAIEIRRECFGSLEECAPGSATIGDFLAMPAPEKRAFAVAIGNPPYSLAREFIEHACRFADAVVFLLRLNFLEGAERHGWLSQNMPDVLVLPQRPSFTGNGTDATAYCWALFTSGVQKETGVIRLLGMTSAEERKANR